MSSWILKGRLAAHAVDVKDVKRSHGATPSLDCRIGWMCGGRVEGESGYKVDSGNSVPSGDSLWQVTRVSRSP